MTNLKAGLVAGVISGLVAGQLADAQRQGKPAKPATPAANEAVFKEIEKTLGFVPQFFRTVSDAQLPTFWTMMKTFQMSSNGALDIKTKELIGLAVASQIPCDYCIYFHTEAARANGATDQQIREAVGMASMTRLGSTILNGNQVDAAQFKKDTQRLLRNDRKKETTAKAP